MAPKNKGLYFEEHWPKNHFGVIRWNAEMPIKWLVPTGFAAAQFDHVLLPIHYFWSLCFVVRDWLCVSDLSLGWKSGTNPLKDHRWNLVTLEAKWLQLEASKTKYSRPWPPSFYIGDICLGIYFVYIYIFITINNIQSWILVGCLLDFSEHLPTWPAAPGPGCPWPPRCWPRFRALGPSLEGQGTSGAAVAVQGTARWTWRGWRKAVGKIEKITSDEP